MSLDFKNLISKGLLTLSDIYGLITKGILKGQLALPHLPPKKTSGAKKKALRKPVVLVSCKQSFNVRGIKQLKGQFSAQLTGVKRFAGEMKLHMVGTMLSTVRLLGQITGIKQLSASSKIVVYGAKTIQRVVTTVVKAISKHKGPGTSALLVGVKLTRGNKSFGSYGRKLTRATKKIKISAVKRLRNKSTIKAAGIKRTKSSSALRVKGRRDITKILAALGLLDQDEED